VRPALPTETPVVEPTATVAPVSAPAAAGGLRAALPLSGEYAVTANADDRTLAVVPIGLARVVATVPLDIAPSDVASAPDSDLAVIAASDSRSVALAALNNNAEVGQLDGGAGVLSVASPAASGYGTVVAVTGDDHVRPFDLSGRTLGAPVSVDAGPHVVSFGRTGAPSVEHVFVANAGAGTVSVLDDAATAVQRTLNVGGKPVGVAQTIDGRLWVAFADSVSVSQVDIETGQQLSSISVGSAVPGLTHLSATRDGHYLVLASRSALISVDLLGGTLGHSSSDVVRTLDVASGVLAVSTGAEPGRAYATTGDGSLVYWDLVANTLTQTIAVGQRPAGLAIGMVVPTGSSTASVAPDSGQVAGGGSTGNASAGGASAGGAAPAPTIGTIGGAGPSSAPTAGISSGSTSSTSGGAGASSVGVSSAATVGVPSSSSSAPTVGSAPVPTIGISSAVNVGAAGGSASTGGAAVPTIGASGSSNAPAAPAPVPTIGASGSSNAPAAPAAVPTSGTSSPPAVGVPSGSGAPAAGPASVGGPARPSETPSARPSVTP